MLYYYPLATGNFWEYKQKDGTIYRNSVEQTDGQLVTMRNSLQPDSTKVKVADGWMYNELMGAGNFQPWLKDHAKTGDHWEAAFTANGLNSILDFRVKETGLTKEIEGKNYKDITLVEAESKINMNGNLISTQFFTQYYYAGGIGLVLTTSSIGDYHGLVQYQLG